MTRTAEYIPHHDHTAIPLSGRRALHIRAMPDDTTRRGISVFPENTVHRCPRQNGASGSMQLSLSCVSARRDIAPQRKSMPTALHMCPRKRPRSPDCSLSLFRHYPSTRRRRHEILNTEHKNVLWPTLPHLSNDGPAHSAPNTCTH